MSCYELTNKFLLPAQFCYVGATQSGKTSLFLKTLKRYKDMYDPPPKRVVYVYKEFGDQFSELEEIEGLSVELVRGGDLNAVIDGLEPIDGETLLAIDDATLETTKSTAVANAVMRGRHR